MRENEWTVARAAGQLSSRPLGIGGAVMTDEALTHFEKASEFLKHEEKELIDILSSEDDLAPRLLRFHLLTEYMMDRIIASRLKRGDRVLEDANLSYHQKLVLVHSLELIPDAAIASLRQLNRIRNALSHERNAKLTIADIETIGRPFGKNYSKLRIQHKGNLKTLAYATFLLAWFELAWELTPEDLKK
jgi:hypothetical protein